MIVLPQMRAVLARHSAGVTEFVPTIKYASVSTTQTRNATSYASLLTFTITTTSTSDRLNFVLSACGVTTSNTPGFQITVDGTSIGETCSTVSGSGESWAVTRVASVTGLSVGSHTVVLNWKSANTNTVSITPSNGVDHCVLVCRLATGTSYATLGSTVTSTASTLTDSLVSTTYTSVQSSSALYIRFSAMGVNNTNTGAKAQISVDGTPVVGCADMGGGTGFGFCMGAVVVVPVTAGSHTIAVKWAGNNSTITVTDPRQHAALLVDEVNTGSPHFAKCTSDLSSGSGSDAASCSITTPAGGSSAILVEATMSPNEAGSASCQASVILDGSTVQQSKVGGESIAGDCGLFMTYVTTGLSSGSHTATLRFIGGSGGLNCATHPEYAHGNIVVWPVTVQP